MLHRPDSQRLRETFVTQARVRVEGAPEPSPSPHTNRPGLGEGRGRPLPVSPLGHSPGWWRAGDGGGLPSLGVELGASGVSDCLEGRKWLCRTGETARERGVPSPLGPTGEQPLGSQPPGPVSLGRELKAFCLEPTVVCMSRVWGWGPMGEEGNNQSSRGKLEDVLFGPKVEQDVCVCACVHVYYCSMQGAVKGGCSEPVSSASGSKGLLGPHAILLGVSGRGQGQACKIGRAHV